MKKRENERRAFLALLPVLSLLQDPVHAAEGAGFVAGIFLAAFFFFRFARKAFPAPLFRLAVILWGAAFFQMLFLRAGLPLLWSLSFFLLLDFTDWHPRSGRFLLRLRGALVRSVLFILLVVLITALRAYAARETAAALWASPSGIFFLLAGLSAIAGLYRPFDRRVRRTGP